MQDLGLQSQELTELESMLSDPQVTHTLKVSEVLSKLLFSRHTGGSATIHIPTE